MLDYNGAVIFDIEANALWTEGVHTVHCIALEDEKGHKELHTDIVEALRRMSKAKLLVGHNICSYDLPVLKDLYQWEPTGAVFDTLIAGNILLPEEVLSLETWAKKLRSPIQKVQHEDWTTYSHDMGRRCQADVSINLAVYRYLLRHKDIKLIANPLLMEQHIAHIHSKQTKHMVSFDAHKAVKLLIKIDEELAILKDRILKSAPWHVYINGVAKGKQKDERADRVSAIERVGLQGVKCTPAKTKAGEHTANTKKYFVKDDGYLKVQGPYTKITIEPTNLNNPAEVKDLLFSLGWVPIERNKTRNKDTGEWKLTSWKLTEESYNSLPAGLGQDIARYNTLKHRRNFLLSIKDASKGAIAMAMRYKGRVPAEAFTCGTPTSRYRHQGTVCNIPRVTSILGKEMRELFRATPGCFQVGIDLAGIEARVLAAYLLKGDYTKAEETCKLILSADKSMDFHTSNAKTWGVSRDTAKSILYAIMYGAGPAKLGAIAGRGSGEGKRMRDAFYKQHPGIKELTDDLANVISSRGYLISLDGRPLYIREGYRALNSLLQNAAAMVFKKWMTLVDEGKGNFPEYNDIHQMIAMHDELQFDCGCTEEVAKKFGKWVCEKALEASQFYNLLVPTAAEYKTGRSWRDCH